MILVLGDPLSVVTAHVFVAAYAPSGKPMIVSTRMSEQRNKIGLSHQPMNRNP